MPKNVLPLISKKLFFLFLGLEFSGYIIKFKFSFKFKDSELTKFTY